MEGESGEQHAISDVTARRAALRALAQRQLGSAAISDQEVTPTTEKPARRRLYITVSAAALVVIALVGLLARMVLVNAPTHAVTQKPVLTINPVADGLVCASQLAWSPDSKKIAVAGAVQSCQGSTSANQLDAVYLYDLTFGKPLAQLHPDAVILNAPAVKQFINASPNAANGTVSINLNSMIWTPDGQALLIAFHIYIMPTDVPANGAMSGQSMDGLLRLGLIQSSSEVWTSTDATTTMQQNDLWRWDLTTGTLSALPAPTAATGYRWTLEGLLVPNTDPNDPHIGATNQGGVFTIWQPGALQYAQVQVGNGQPSFIPQDIQWVTSQPAVSPDGRYYYPSFFAMGSLIPPSMQQAFPGERTLMPRDKAMLAMAKQLYSASMPIAQSTMLLAWRPDGRYLAALPNNPLNLNDTNTFTVALYDSATGNLVKKVTPKLSLSATTQSSVEILNWSPDGSHLLLMDNAVGEITVWGPGALPS